MNSLSINKKISDLRDTIRYHEHRYYQLNNPEISDEQFDRLMAELIALETRYPELITADSPSQRVGGKPLKEFKNIPHRLPMVSLDNTYSREEIMAWEIRIRKLSPEPIHYVVEPKIDGVSLSLTYVKGMLAQALTRGDGAVGEDVTANARTIRSIPLRLSASAPMPDIFEVRGEAFMNKKDFERLNEHRVKNGEEPFANARNATAGSLKLLDSRITAARAIRFLLHSRGYVSTEPGYATHFDFFTLCRKCGLPVSEHVTLCKTITDVIHDCEQLEQKRDSLAFEIDGAVVKVNDIRQQEQMGMTMKSPRWAIAFKFTARQATTTVRSIVHQVGRTGVITPVAELEPVACGGVTISRATLHNYDEIKRLHIHQGDTVLLERAGDVIPKIIKVVRHGSATRDEQPVKPPEQCPVCRADIVKEKEGDVAFRCVNNTCPAQLARGMFHFASRGAMDIEGLGEAAIEQLINHGLIRDVADIYFVAKTDLLKLDLFAETKADNVVNAVIASKKRPLHKLLHGLGIRNIGEKAAILLAEKFNNLTALSNASEDDLVAIPEIGPVMAHSIIQYFHLPSTIALIAKLKKAGVNFDAEEMKSKSHKLAGMTVVVTGTIEPYTRLQIEDMIREHGGKPTGSVTKKTDLLVTGSDPGTKKDKAEKLGVRIIAGSDFISMLTQD